ERVRLADPRIVLQGALIDGDQVGGAGTGRGEDQGASGDDERSAYFHLCLFQSLIRSPMMTRWRIDDGAAPGTRPSLTINGTHRNARRGLAGGGAPAGPPRRPCRCNETHQ